MKYIDKYYVRKFLLILFTYGVVIAILTSYINYNLTHKEIINKVVSQGTAEIITINKEVTHYTANIEKVITALKGNKLFKKFLDINSEIVPDSEQCVADQLFLNTIDGHTNYFQVRYIDSNGMERIRAERVRKNESTFLVPEDKLQDKKSRYYFEEAMKLSEEQFWYSPLDLNIEHNQLELPIRPTFRVATPVYHKGKSKGIIIVNVDMADFLTSISSDTHDFDLYIANKEGYILEEPSGQFAFSLFQGKGITIFDLLPKLTLRDWKEGFSKEYRAVIHSFGLPVTKGEKLSIMLVPKEELIKKLDKTLLENILQFSLVILFLSIPLSLIVAIPAARIHKKLLIAEEENEQYVKKVELAVRIDTLTQLANRYAIDEKLNDTRASFERYQHSFSALLIDIDHFKAVNDNYGHLIGDQVLQSLGNILKKSVRETDFPGRWGGEEFIIICEETTLDGANELADKILKIVQQYQFDKIPKLTVSIGVTEFHKDDTIQTFLNRLDKALYTAKESGRNRVIVT